MTQLSDITFKSYQEILDNQKKLLSVDDFDTNKKLYKGDHWRNGAGWSGPKPDPSTDSIASASVMTRIKRQFVSKNAVREVITRHVNSLFGNLPSINVVPNREMGDEDEISEDEQNSINEINDAINEWIKNKRVFETMKKALTYSLYGGKSTLRFYIPKGNLDENSRLEDVETLKDAMSKIYLDTADADMSTVYEDNDTKRQIGVFKGVENDPVKDQEVEFIEVAFQVIQNDLNPIDEDEEAETAEFMTSENVYMSFVLIIKDGEDEYQITEPIQLHGNITMFEIKRDTLITPQVIQNQDLLNKTLTMWSANLDWSGFVERIILNGMPPGEWKKDDSTNEMEYVQKGELKSGPSTTAFVSGVPKFNETGEIVGAESPQVVFRDPIDPKTFEVTRMTSYMNILEECHQSHVLLNSEAGQSGISRRESRQDYLDDIKGSKTAMDLAGNWMVNTLLFLAQWLIGNEADEPEYRSDFTTHMTVGAVTKEDVEMLAILKENGWISDETAMSRAGVDDVIGERSRIDTAIAHVRDVVEILRDSELQSPTLARKMMELVIRDIEVFNTIEDSELDTILGEIEQASQKKVEEADFMTQLRQGGGVDEEKTDEE